MSLAGARLEVTALGGEPLMLRPIAPSPCATACPAGINVKAYVSLIAEGRFAEALAVVRDRCPLPGICGRICHHPCEAACRREEPVAIRALKRFVADVVEESPPPVVPETHPEMPVAIIGSGPAGLSAAWDLRRAGYPVTIFESEPEPGGMLRYGIAPYRLPREVLDAEIGYLLSAGIGLRTGCRIGRDLELRALLDDGWAAVLFAVGAQRGRLLGVPGELEAPQVEDALGFLRRVNAGDRARVRGRVLVIGGGSTAVEAARTARRLGAREVTILYRRSPAELLAGPEEIEAAKAEGVRFRFLVAPSAVVRDDSRFMGLECLEVELGEPDDSGRRRPLPVPRSEFLLEADRVLAAVGQQAELDFLPDKVLGRVAGRGLLQVDAETAMTAMHGVFAAGDVVSGPATVIDAVAAGHRAAASVLQYLERGRPGAAPPPASSPPEFGLEDPAPVPAAALRPPLRPIRRGREFDETELAFTPATAIAEAGRCLRCGPCSECVVCASSCPRRHFGLRAEGGGAQALRVRAPASFTAALDGAAAGRLWKANTEAASAVELLPLGVGLRAPRCRACGECVAVCPFDALGLEAAASAVEIDAGRCRGCLLCSAVCPTGALDAPGDSPDGWLRGFTAGAKGAAPWVVVACARRTAGLHRPLRIGRRSVELLSVPCVGGLGSGRLLELFWRGAAGVLVAGCGRGRCRFGDGAELAAAQTADARELLALVGRDPRRLLADWANDPDHDPIALRLPVLLGRTKRRRREVAA